VKANGETGEPFSKRGIILKKAEVNGHRDTEAQRAGQCRNGEAFKKKKPPAIHAGGLSLPK
jgi:hypothetical protein